MQNWESLSEKEKVAILNSDETVDIHNKTVEKTVVTKTGKEASAPSATMRIIVSFADMDMKDVLSLANNSIIIKYQAKLRAEWKSAPELINTYNNTCQRIDAQAFMQSLGKTGGQRTDAEKLDDAMWHAYQQGLINEEQYRKITAQKAVLIRKRVKD